MSQRSTAQHYHTDTPFCTIRKSHVTWNFAVPGPHSEEIRRCILLFLCTLDRPYFSKPRKYRRLFSEPTYWPRRSRGQYGEGNNQAGIFEAEGNKSLIPERLARWPLTCPSTRKVRDESVVSLCSERYNASTGSPSPTGPKWFDRLFSTCIRQLADSPGG